MQPPGFLVEASATKYSITCGYGPRVGSLEEEEEEEEEAAGSAVGQLPFPMHPPSMKRMLLIAYTMRRAYDERVPHPCYAAAPHHPRKMTTRLGLGPSST